MQLVTQEAEFLEGSLLQNLLYGVVPAAAIEGGAIVDEAAAAAVPSLWTLWRLCVRIGVSSSVVGASYDPAWGALPMTSSTRSWMLLEDRVKLALARALLHRPSVPVSYTHLTLPTKA